MARLRPPIRGPGSCPWELTATTRVAPPWSTTTGRWPLLIAWQKDGWNIQSWLVSTTRSERLTVNLAVSGSRWPPPPPPSLPIDIFGIFSREFRIFPSVFNFLVHIQTHGHTHTHTYSIHPIEKRLTCSSSEYYDCNELWDVMNLE